MYSNKDILTCIIDLHSFLEIIFVHVTETQFTPVIYTDAKKKLCIS